MMNMYEWEATLYSHYAQMRATSPVFFNPDSNVWEIYSYEYCQEVLSDASTFSSAAFNAIGHPDMQTLITMDPPHHTRLRRLIAKAFTSRLVNMQASQIQRLADELIDRVIDRGEFDIIEHMALPVPAAVIATMLGIPKMDLEQFLSWTEACIKVIGGATGQRVPEPHLMSSVQQMTAYLTRIVIDRRAEPREDLISELATAVVDDELLTIEELGNACRLLVNVGYESTQFLIGNMMHLLLNDTDLLARVRTDSALFDSAVEEVLRYATPAQFFARIATRDVELGGQIIKAGQWVKVILGSANRDESVFPDADRFDVTRHPNRHISFGHGIHYCLGAPLARLENRICVNTMLTRLPDLRINPDKPGSRVGHAYLYGWRSLPALFTPRGR